MMMQMFIIKQIIIKFVYNLRLQPTVVKDAYRLGKHQVLNIAK